MPMRVRMRGQLAIVHDDAAARHADPLAAEIDLRRRPASPAS